MIARIFTCIILFAFSVNAELIKSPSGGDFKVGNIDTKKFRGKSLFIFFGFSKCPQVCPLTLSHLKQLVSLLPEDQKDSVRVLFISVDNVRDSALTLNEFIKPFGPQFLAATGTDYVLRSVASKFGARFARYKTKSGALLVDHTSSVFVVNKKGIWTQQLDLDVSAQELLQARNTAETISRPPVSPEFEAQSLGENKRCNLSQKICTQNLQNNARLTLELTPRPAKTQEDVRLTAHLQNLNLVPVEADVNGKEINMGYIRPALAPDASGGYTAKVNLPICELKKMNWVVRLILKDAEDKKYSVTFHFDSKDNP